MKSLITLMSVLLVGANAFADGFVCRTVERDLVIRAYNHVQPTNGTRLPAKLIVSDPSVQVGNKTIATFDSEGTLSGGSFKYAAKVDLRRTGSSRVGEYISGTRLGQLAEIDLIVDHDYSRSPMSNGSLTKGWLILVKRNGDTMTRDLECKRYLKN